MYKNMAQAKKMADIESVADPKIMGDGKIMAEVKIMADPKIMADDEILVARENQADGKILAPGEIPAAMEMPAELEKQAACLLFRHGGNSNCWFLPGPADEHVLLLIDVMNLEHVVSRWGIAPQCPAFMGGLSPELYRLLVPARHAKKWPKFYWFLSNHSSL